MQSIEPVQALVDRVVTEEGLRLLEVQWTGASRNQVLRIYIDRIPEGVTLEDCERISKRLSVLLDVEDLIPSSYHLEVSSPGLDRKLLCAEDYQRFLGRMAKIQTRIPIEKGCHYQGRLVKFSDGVITLALSRTHHIEIPVDQVEKANLMVEW
ncbi:MAG: ribosome maturation factor RimP [Acidobacteriia bacterium]|nr:ribosome maturation factor RimP [Terriglobia bacterium]